jgi:hypothetical protein
MMAYDGLTKFLSQSVLKPVRLGLSAYAKEGRLLKWLNFNLLLSLPYLLVSFPFNLPLNLPYLLLA